VSYSVRCNSPICIREQVRLRTFALYLGSGSNLRLEGLLALLLDLHRHRPGDSPRLPWALASAAALHLAVVPRRVDLIQVDLLLACEKPRSHVREMVWLINAALAGTWAKFEVGSFRTPR
jgi:hypothetical protein